jgi:hypothetical protein
MDRQQGRRDAASGEVVEPPRDGLVIRFVQRLDARLAVGGRKRSVARDRGAVADRPHGGGIVQVAVAVDHEAGIAGQQRGCAQLQRHTARDIGGADVPADVARALALVEAEIA